MSDRSVMPELARSLPEADRRKLLKKLQGSLNISSEEEESIYKKPVEKDERELLIESDLRKVGFFTRFRIWLRKLFTGKDTKEVFISMRLGSLKSTIQQRARGITAFDTRALQPACGEAFFKLYVAVLPLVRLYRQLWSNTKKFETTIEGLIEKKIENKREVVYDFISFEEMEAIYEQNSTKSALRENFIAELENYVKNLPEEIFENALVKILPVYFLKDVVLFPYNEFFKLFKFVFNEKEGKPVFKSASAGVALEYLEKMYYGLYLVSKIEKDHEFDEELAEELCAKTDGEKPEEQGPCDDLEDRDFDNLIDDIIGAAGVLKEKVPMVELIRYYKGDPYYQLIFYIPKLHLRDFYLSKLKLEMLPKIDDIFPQVRKKVIEKRIQELFPGKRPEPLLYYRDYTTLDYKDLGLPTFTHTRSINLMYNFILVYYRKKLQNIIQILTQSVLKQNRITLNRLLVNSAAVEDLEEKIKLFDDSLSPDEDDGKLFQRIRHSLANDSGHQRLYRSLVQQKDNEVKQLLEKGKESFLGIKKIFDEFLASPMDEIKQRINTHYYIDGASRTLGSVLKVRSEQIDKFRNLLFEVAKIE